MSGFSWPLFGFIVVALGTWGVIFWWAWQQRRDRWHHFWVLGLATAFWWVGESCAIRLGKYEYPDFPNWTRLPLPWGGTPTDPGRVTEYFLSVVGAAEKQFGACIAGSWAIPIPVFALEGAILFALYRLSVLRFQSKKGDGVRTALATAGLSALLMYNVTAVLDPVVSTTRWCDPTAPDPNHHGLNFGIWRWFTNETHQGYWFGVPFVNFATWMLAAGTFNFVARLDGGGPGGIVKRYKTLAGYVLAALLLLILLFVILIPVKKVVDRLLVHGQEYLFFPHPIFFPRVWQFGVLLLLLATSFLLMMLGRRNTATKVEWITATPLLLVFAFCLLLLSVQPHRVIFAIWLVTTSIAVAVIFWPRIVGIVARLQARFGKPEPSSLSDVGLDV